MDGMDFFYSYLNKIIITDLLFLFLLVIGEIEGKTSISLHY